MRYVVLAALAATSLASPAMAMDKSWYAGIEGGLLFPQDETISADGFGDIIDIDYKTGVDLDAIVGYDFGLFRLEGELGYKRAKHSGYEVAFFDTGEQLSQEGPPTTNQVVNGLEVDANGNTRVWSLMLNGLLDFNISERFALYAGGGVGYHSTRVKIDFDNGIESGSIKDSGFAWQLIAGARYAVSDNIDLGLKYRYFRTDRLKDEGLETRFSSHSVLASLIYNFAPPPPPPPPPPAPPPPPPPPPPATQTCPDGSVILATDACPPPPPPPPPPPEPERG